MTANAASPTGIRVESPQHLQALAAKHPGEVRVWLADDLTIRATLAHRNGAARINGLATPREIIALHRRLTDRAYRIRRGQRVTSAAESAARTSLRPRSR